MNVGPQTSAVDAFVVPDRTLELGIDFIDTADVDGGKKGEGITEQILGRWLAQGGGRRDGVVLEQLREQPAVSAPIVGPLSLEQLGGSVRALEIELTKEPLAKLDALFPGPGGATPEACAW